MNGPNGRNERHLYGSKRPKRETAEEEEEEEETSTSTFGVARHVRQASVEKFFSIVVLVEAFRREELTPREAIDPSPPLPLKHSSTFFLISLGLGALRGLCQRAPRCQSDGVDGGERARERERESRKK